MDTIPETTYMVTTLCPRCGEGHRRPVPLSQLAAATGLTLCVACLAASAEVQRIAVFVEQLFKALAIGGRLIIKDVDTRPAYKRWFTHALDRLMDPTTPVRYWSAE